MGMWERGWAACRPLLVHSTVQISLGNNSLHQANRRWLLGWPRGLICSAALPKCTLYVCAKHTEKIPADRKSCKNYPYSPLSSQELPLSLLQRHSPRRAAGPEQTVQPQTTFLPKRTDPPPVARLPPMLGAGSGNSPVCLDGANEELGAVGVGACVCHGQDT